MRLTLNPDSRNVETLAVFLARGLPGVSLERRVLDHRVEPLEVFLHGL
jgi:hypothetical protein